MDLKATNVKKYCHIKAAGGYISAQLNLGCTDERQQRHDIGPYAPDRADGHERQNDQTDDE